MEKNISLSENKNPRKHLCDRKNCTACQFKREKKEEFIDKRPGENDPNTLQAHYTALLQYYSSHILHVKQDNGYLHCT